MLETFNKQTKEPSVFRNIIVGNEKKVSDDVSLDTQIPFYITMYVDS